MLVFSWIARRVATPRYPVIDRLAADGMVEILGLVHDRKVLSRAARRSFEPPTKAEEGGLQTFAVAG